MKTNVSPIFEGPSDFSGMFKTKATQPTTTTAAKPMADFDPAQHGRWYAMAKHANDQQIAKQNAQVKGVHPNNPRYVA